MGDFQRKSVIMLDKITGKKFMTCAREYIGKRKNHGGISACCCGKLKRAYGYRWKFAEN